MVGVRGGAERVWGGWGWAYAGCAAGCDVEGGDEEAEVEHEEDGGQWSLGEEPVGVSAPVVVVAGHVC